MKILNFKRIILAIAIVMSIASCRDSAKEDDKNLPPVTSKEGNTVYVDTANVPVDSGKATEPIIQKNSEDGGDSGL